MRRWLSKYHGYHAKCVCACTFDDYNSHMCVGRDGKADGKVLISYENLIFHNFPKKSISSREQHVCVRAATYCVSE